MNYLWHIKIIDVIKREMFKANVKVRPWIFQVKPEMPSANPSWLSYKYASRASSLVQTRWNGLNLSFYVLYGTKKKYGFVLTKHGIWLYLMTLYRLRIFFRTEPDNLWILETGAKKKIILKEFFSNFHIIWKLLAPIAFTNIS